MSKRLTKTIWYGSDVDSNGNPILPSTHGGLDGLNYGELFLHLSNGKATLWTLSSDGKIVEITGGGSEVDMSSYLLKSIWDKVFEIRTDSQGTEYIFGKLPMVTQYGITMYSGDGVDVPSLASGLPFDGRTIWYNPDTNQIEVIGGTGGGSGEGVSNFWDLSGIPSWITNSKPKYTYSEIEGTPDLTKYALVSQIPSLSGYATESWVAEQNYATKATTLSGYGITDAYTKTNVDDLLKSYVTLGGTQTITGEKNFTGGLKVNGSPIYYDTEKKYWKLEGDLLVTGGVTMYGSDSSFNPSTIMDAIAVDGTTISKSGGILKVIGGTGGGVADSVAWANITGKPTWIGSSKPSYSYSEITGAISTTELQNYLTQNSYLNVTSGDNRYLKLSGGTIYSSIFYGLSINSNDSSINRSAIVFLYDNSNKSQFGWDGYNGRGTFMYNYPSSSYLGIKDNGTLVFNDNDLIHSGNYSRYALPLSGGTLSGNLTIQNKTVDVITLYRDDVNNSPSIKCANKSDGTLGYIGVSGSGSGIGIQPFFMDSAGTVNKIWHSGNDGSGSGLDADLLDGKHATDFMQYSTGGKYVRANLINSELWSLAGGNGYIEYYDSGIWFNSQWGKVTAHYGFEGSLSGNASSATKLQTPRTIWGQSFDGTGNVSGNLTLENNYEIVTKNTSGSISSTLYRTKSNNLSIGEGIAKESNDTYISGNNLFLRYGTGLTNGISLISSGNVGIGTTSPSYTLDVRGTCRASTSVTSNMFFTNGEYGIWKGSSFTGGLSANDLAYYAEKNVFYGNVGMGTTNPSAKLEIESSNFHGLHINSKDSSVDRSAMVFKKDGVYKAQFGWDALSSMGVFMYSYPSSFYLGIKDDGSLVFGKYSINFSVDSSGNGLFYGGVTMYSQRSLKNVVDERGLSLNELSTIKPTRYTWKDGRDNRLHFGGIADDIQQVLPEVVYSTSDGILTMDYGNAAFAVASSLIHPVIDHEKRIAMLQKRIVELEEEVERLKSA